MLIYKSSKLLYKFTIYQMFENSLKKMFENSLKKNYVFIKK